MTVHAGLQLTSPSCLVRNTLVCSPNENQMGDAESSAREHVNLVSFDKRVDEIGMLILAHYLSGL